MRGAERGHKSKRNEAQLHALEEVPLTGENERRLSPFAHVDAN